MEFQGYKRDGGKYGVRNHVLVVSSVSRANGVVDAIGRIFPDVVTIQHTYGCGYGPDDFMTSMKVLSGIINNPNVGREIFELCLKVAGGELTRAEINRSTPFSCLKTGPTF